MFSTNKKDRCLRSSLFGVNCAASIAIVYIYCAYIGKQQKFNVGGSTDAFIHSEKMTDERCIPVCDSKACIWHGNMLLRNMDSEVDPCDNFDSFLCGGFKDKYGFEENGNVISESKSPMLNKLKDILENIQAQPESASSKMKTVYDSCLNYRSSELRGIKDFKGFLSNLGLINWPNLSEDFKFNNINLPTVLGNLMDNEASVIAYLVRRSSNENEMQADYFSNREECNENCSDVYRIDCSGKRNDDWQQLCETLQVFLNVTGQVSIKPISINIQSVNFFKNLFPLWDSFSHKSVANFLVLNFIVKFQGEINFYFRLSKLKHKHFEDTADRLYFEIDRWRYCVRWIAKNMKVALSNEFVNQYLSHTVIEEVNGFYNNYTLDLINMIADEKWIPSEKKLEFENSIKEIQFNVQILGQILPNDSYVNKYHEKFHPTAESFFKNALHFKRFVDPKLMPEKFRILAGLASMTEFEVQASEMDPFIIIQYGMLLPPFYIPDHISLLNQASLASILGHEIGHHITTTMRTFPEIYEKFPEKQQCVRDQFSKFKFRALNENLNGSQYDVENMPDNIVSALLDKIVEKFYSPENESFLPGLPYTTKQLHYMSASKMWCSKSSLEQEMEYKNKRAHALSEFRIIGMMQNSKGFSQEFHCPDGSFMNPVEKCSLLASS